MRGKTTSEKWAFSRHIMLVDSLFNVQTDINKVQENSKYKAIIKVNKHYLLPAHEKGGKLKKNLGKWLLMITQGGKKG